VESVVIFAMLCMMAASILFYELLATLPSLHRFIPNPLKPKECAHCGRRREVHIRREETA
jgi:hypothetical protein